MVLVIIFAIVILIIAIPFIMAYAGDAVDDIRQDREDQDNAKTFGNNPKAGDIICDLTVRIEGQLDFNRSTFAGSLGLGNLVVYMGEEGGFKPIAEYKWERCRTSGTFSLLSLLSFFGNTGIGLQELALITGDSFDIEMTGMSKTNGKLLTENSKIKVWTNEVIITTSIVPIIELSSTDVPIFWETHYYLTSVKADDYRVEFVAIGGSINEMDTNKPLRYTICGPGKSSC